jgi:hypothetical protein
MIFGIVLLWVKVTNYFYCLNLGISIRCKILLLNKKSLQCFFLFGVAKDSKWQSSYWNNLTFNLGNSTLATLDLSNNNILYPWTMWTFHAQVLWQICKYSIYFLTTNIFRIYAMIYAIHIKTHLIHLGLYKSSKMQTQNLQY